MTRLSILLSKNGRRAIFENWNTFWKFKGVDSLKLDWHVENALQTDDIMFTHLYNVWIEFLQMDYLLFVEQGVVSITRRGWMEVPGLQ